MIEVCQEVIDPITLEIVEEVTVVNIDVGDYIVGGGSNVFVTITKADIDDLISTNSLVIGTTYEITGVHPTLYDDGTTLGTTIYLVALTENTLTKEGHGIFFNPKYNKNVTGYGIWSNRSKWIATLTSGNFKAREFITANNGAIGQLFSVLDTNLFIALSGNWAAATSITGNVSGATATVTSIILKSYAIGSKVIWGGYSWTNVNGNVGTDTAILVLNNEWSKDVYDETNYNKVLDVIEYDYENDWISKRADLEFSNTVVNTKTFNDYSDFEVSSISTFQFGNKYDNTTYYGVYNNSVYEAFCENINFQGKEFSNNEFSLKGAFYDNKMIGKYCNIKNLVIYGYYYYNDNIFYGEDYTAGIDSVKSGIGGDAVGYSDFYNANIYYSSIEGFMDNCVFKNKSIHSLTMEVWTSFYNNLSTSTVIDGNYPKTAFASLEGTTKIRYFNDYGVMVIADITD